MVTMRTRIAMAPEGQLSPSMSMFEDKDQSSLFKALSDDVKEKAYFEQEEAKTRALELAAQKVNKSVINIQEEKCAVEGEESSTPTTTSRMEATVPPQSRLDKLSALKDSAVLNTIERVAKYANDGKNPAKGPVEAWRTADTKILQEKAKTRCAGMCRELWTRLEKQKKQVMGIRLENTHYMNNLSKEEQEKGSRKRFFRRSVIKEEEDESKNTFSGTATQGTFDEQEENENEFCLQKTAIVEEEDVERSSAEVPKRSEDAECKDTDNAENLIEVKCPYGSPLTIETECESSDGEDTLGFTDVLTDNDINVLSTSDDICAVQRSTIDFALAIIDCDVVLVDITLMQSLILVAEKAIHGKVFKAPVRRPALNRGESTRSIGSHIAKVSAKVSRRATTKMNAIQRAIAKVDNHRRKQRFSSQ